MLRSVDVEALAPDVRSVAAARPLLMERWAEAGRDAWGLWGRCRGYRVAARLQEPASRCSCPSPKHPCKHALALMLLAHEVPGAVPAGERPEWAQDLQPIPPAPPRAPDPLARERREASISEGLQELDVFLRDVARQGLAALQPRGYAPWDEMAKRMVDAKAAGVARLLRDLGGSVASGRHGADWAGAALERLGRLALLTAGWSRRSALGPEEGADLRTQVGGSWNAEELLRGWGVQDRWAVVGQRSEVDELCVQRTWLQGLATRRTGLVLEFSYGDPVFPSGLQPGTTLEAELVFGDSAWPQRCLVRDRQGLPDRLSGLPQGADCDGAGRTLAEALARNPWLDRVGVGLRRVLPLRREPRWLLRDVQGAGLPLHPRFTGEWSLLAVSGGHPVDMFGEWDGEAFRPLSAWVEGRFVGLG